MKKFLIAAALMFAAIPAQAQVINEEICVTLGDYGGKVMELRQLGVSKQSILGQITTTDSVAYQLLLAIVDFAYGMPISTSPDIIDELATNKCLDCLLYTSPSSRDRQKSRMPSSA